MDHIASGQMLGPYRIIGQIGQGGMATVYKAYQPAMDRYVAVKVLPRQLADSPEFIGRFQQEARTIAKLEHARILPVFDFGEQAGVTYLVMRFLEAGTLKDRMTAALSLGEADRLFTQLAEALDYAHRNGIIHRDLKPSNAMLDAQGDLYLTDFGIAKLLASQSQFTSTGAMMGTPAYMSPEQAQGDKVDQRTDIYSLGIILYEMVTGRVPFEAETPLAVVLKQINAPLPLPTSLRPDLPSGVERVLLKALAKNPDDRYASVAEFLAAWKQALSEVSTVRAAAPSTGDIKASAPTVFGPPGASHTVAAQTRISSAAPEAVAKPASAVRSGLPLGWLLGGAGVVVVALIVIAAIVLPRLGRNRAAPEATLTPASVTAPTDAAGGDVATESSAGEPTAELVATEPAAESDWASWSSANRVRQVRIQNGELYAAGPGGVTVWNLADGNYLRRYTTGNGLPHPNVFAIEVDDDGTLWVGTEGGLARLDPATQEWIHYTRADGLDSEFVTAVARAGEYLIVGTQYSGLDGGGLNLFDGQRWETSPDYPSLPLERALAEGQLSDAVNTLLPAPGGVLWVGTDTGLARYEQASEAWTRFSTENGLPSDRIFSLYVDNEGALLAGTEAGVARFDGESFDTTEQGPPYGVLGIAQDLRGRYYFSGGGGIWRYDAANANWDEFSTGTGAIPVYETDGVVLGDDGALYFGSDGAGVLRFADEEFAPWYVRDSTTVYAFGRILLPPEGGVLWFVEAYGAYTDGFNLGAQAWEADMTAACECGPLGFELDGTLWGSRYDQGLVIFAPAGELINLTTDNGLPSNFVTAVAFDPIDGHYLIGTEGGVVHLDSEKNIVEVFNSETVGLVDDAVTALLTTADPPATWVGTRRGVSHLTADFTWEHFPVGAPFTENLNFISDIAQGLDGAIWVATDNDWVYRYFEGEWQQFVGGQTGVTLPSPYVHSVTVAPSGAVWFGAEGGATYFDGSAWQTYKVRDGLINNGVNDVYVEADGTVWFATSGGVTRWWGP